MKLNHYIYSLIAGLVLMLSPVHPMSMIWVRRPMYPMTWRKVLPTL